MQHRERNGPVVAEGERIAHLCDDARDRHGSGRAAAPGEPVPEREGNGEHEPDCEEDEGTPHLDGASIRRRSAGR